MVVSVHIKLRGKEIRTYQPQLCLCASQIGLRDGWDKHDKGPIIILFSEIGHRAYQIKDNIK